MSLTEFSHIAGETGLQIKTLSYPLTSTTNYTSPLNSHDCVASWLTICFHFLSLKSVNKAVYLKTKGDCVGSFSLLDSMHGRSGFPLLES